ncbi:MAG: YIP1 family protein [Chlamydiales bacterium]|nr:YIP1 family protein [Chlamydiales bacterium]
MDEKKINPWWKIWFAPRQTISAILATNKSYGFKRICFVYGFVMCLNIARSMFLGSSYSLLAILIASIVLAFPFGFITISISSGLFYWIGKLFKGRGSFYDVRGAVTWSNVTSIVTALSWILLMVLYGTQIFTQDFMLKQLPKTDAMILQGVSILQLVLGVWGLVILLHAYGEAQGCSAWMSLLNFVIVCVLWFIILVLCVLVTYVLLKSTTVATLIL